MTVKSSFSQKKWTSVNQKSVKSQVTFHWLLPDFLFYRAWVMIPGAVISIWQSICHQPSTCGLPMVLWWGMSWSIYSGHSINISFQSWCDSTTLRDYKTSSMLLRSDKYNTYLVVGNNPFNKTIHKHLMSKLGSIDRWWLWRVDQVTTELLHLICGLCSQPSLPLMVIPCLRLNLIHSFSVQVHKMIMKVAWPCTFAEHLHLVTCRPVAHSANIMVVV